MSDAAFVVVLHRLEWGPHRTQQVTSLGLQVVESKSVAQTVAAVEAGVGRRGVVLVDLGVGGNAPERIARVVQQHPGFSLIACTLQMSGGLTSRGQKLGVDRVCVFPEGALTRVFELAPDVPRLEMRRSSERALIQAELAGAVLPGTLVNLSATGALIEVKSEDANVDVVSFAFQIPGTEAPVEFRGRVCWRDPGPVRTGLGVAFLNLSEATRASLARFVSSLNVIRIGAASSPPSPVSKPEKVRVQRVGDSRVDYFDLDGDVADEEGALVVPRGDFSVWWNVGDRISVRRQQNGKSLTVVAAVVARVALDPDRVDGRIAWRVRQTG